MKTTSTYHKIVILVLMLMMSAPLWADKNVDWKAFSKNLAEAIKSENPGLQQSAMCMMVQYGDKLDIDRDIIFDIVHIFRVDKEENVRLLAMMALYKLEDPWAMDFLKRHRKFEKQERIHRLCCCAVQTYYAKMDSIKNEGAILVSAENQVVEMHAAKAKENIEVEQYGF